MAEKTPFYITTAIAYASSKPHIGNTYEVILTDAIARYKRMRGYDVFFLTGTDEHGQKVEQLAKEKGVSPQQYVDDISAQIRQIWDTVGASYDHFIRTTDEQHQKVVQKIFTQLYEQGDIYKGEYEGWYCVPCESFFTQTQLVDGCCPDCGRPVRKTKEEAYFFKMSKYAQQLQDYIDSHPDFIVPESRKKEMVNNFLSAGLQDLCISRSSFQWGIPVPVDHRHVIYVWLDALVNYISALGYKTDDDHLFQKYWPADVHVIGKDILRFHTIYWPIFLMALGVPLPKTVFGHPWINFGTDKMSKSKGNVIYADDLAARLGADAVRHYVLSEVPYAADGSITYESVIARYNTDLANNLGNLVSRTAAMTEKYFDGVIPQPQQPTDFDEDLRAAAAQTVRDYTAAMDTYHVADASEAVFTLLRRANKYIDETTPWTLAKDESLRPQLATVLYNLLETIRIGAVLLTPFLPQTAAKICQRLSADADYESVLDFGGLKSGVKLQPGAILFERLDEQKTVQQLRQDAPKPQPAKPEQKPQAAAQIGIEDFSAVELRVAQIVACEPVPKSDKLLRIEADLGGEIRQIVSGIAPVYTPTDLIGKKVIVVANLKPAKLRGVESNGMLLAAGEKTPHVVFVADDVPNGERVR